MLSGFGAWQCMPALWEGRTKRPWSLSGDQDSHKALRPGLQDSQTCTSSQAFELPHAHAHAMAQAMHAFRDNKATLLLATPRAARGLDLPGVTHVFNLGVPDGAVEYVHRAGRVGRLGSLTPGAQACSPSRSLVA